jgi:import inner membrane translocase subunit TIM16
MPPSDQLARLSMSHAYASAAALQSYEHLFKTNAPPAPKGATGGGAGSFYIQSKVVRARERIEAEWAEVLKASKGPPPPPDASAPKGPEAQQGPAP